MRVESTVERVERELREAGEREQMRQRPGRTLPVGCQWTGLDQPGCGAARRRLRQVARQQAKEVEE